MAVQTPAKTSDKVRKLAELIKDVQFAMLTTVCPDGSLRSRPMATQQVDFDGDLWFFTRASAPKASELEQHAQVNVSYANPDDQRYVSVSGRAEIVRDREKAASLWNPVYRAWFPDGLDDPDLALIRVDVETAEYWDPPSGAMVQLYGYVKAAMTGQPPKPGGHEKLHL